MTYSTPLRDMMGSSSSSSYFGKSYSVRELLDTPDLKKRINAFFFTEGYRLLEDGEPILPYDEWLNCDGICWTIYSGSGALGAVYDGLYIVRRKIGSTP